MHSIGPSGNGNADASATAADVANQEALERGLDANVKKFVEKGAEICAKA